MKLWGGKLKSHSRRGEYGTFVVILFFYSIIGDNRGALIGVLMRRPQKIFPGEGICRRLAAEDRPVFNWNIEQKIQFIFIYIACATIQNCLQEAQHFRHKQSQLSRPPSGLVSVQQQILNCAPFRLLPLNGHLILLLCKVVSFVSGKENRRSRSTAPWPRWMALMEVCLYNLIRRLLQKGESIRTRMGA